MKYVQQHMIQDGTVTIIIITSIDEYGTRQSLRPLASVTLSGFLPQRNLKKEKVILASFQYFVSASLFNNMCICHFFRMITGKP